MPSPPATVDDLGVEGALYLHALLAAQAGRRPVTPTRKLTLQAMGVLRDVGVIALPFPEARWAADPDAESTPLADLQWRYAWPAYARDQVRDALADFLGEVATDEGAVELRIRIWRVLLKAECQQYFEFQLARSYLPAECALDIEFLVGGPGVELSLAQWRYCLWAAVREGGALSARRCFDDATLRQRIFDEAKRRSGLIASGRWTTEGFGARADEPVSGLSRAFLRHLAPIGDAFFLAAPGVGPWRRAVSEG